MFLVGKLLRRGIIYAIKHGIKRGFVHEAHQSACIVKRILAEFPRDLPRRQIVRRGKVGVLRRLRHRFRAFQDLRDGTRLGQRGPEVGSHRAAELLPQSLHEDDAGRMPVVVPVSLVVEIEASRVLHHRLEQRLVSLVIGPVGRLGCGRHGLPRPHRGQQLLGSMHVEIGVIEIQIRQDESKQSFRPAQTILEGLYVLRRGVPPAVRGLIIRALCGRPLGSRDVFPAKPWSAYRSCTRCSECKAACRRTWSSCDGTHRRPLSLVASSAWDEPAAWAAGSRSQARPSPEGPGHPGCPGRLHHPACGCGSRLRRLGRPRSLRERNAPGWIARSLRVTIDGTASGIMERTEIRSAQGPGQNSTCHHAELQRSAVHV